MQILVWPDVHHRVSLLQKVLENHGDKFEKRIFLGDWFDQFNDRTEDAGRTAEFLIKLMEDPRNIFLEGNHDTSYKYGNAVSYCSGFSFEKLRLINSILDRSHWDKFKLFHMEGNIILSHAGVHPYVFQHPVVGINKEQMEKDCEVAMQAARSNMKHPIYSAGISSGGTARFGGINWLRWWELAPIEGFDQIVGHTTVAKPEVIYLRKKNRKKPDAPEEHWRFRTVRTQWDNYVELPPKRGVISMNYNIDTDNAYFIIIKDGVVDIKLTLDYL